MLVTWTVLRTAAAAATPPWTPAGATWTQAGAAGPGRAQAPEADGRWWAVLATWPDRAPAEAGPPATDGTAVWHVVLEAYRAHGDVVMAGGARPFDGLRPGSAPAGPVVLLTAASSPPDEGREREFGRRFGHVARDVDRADGLLAALVQVPEGSPAGGPVVTLTAWRDESAGTAWAYEASSPHTSAVARQREHGLVALSGSVRCAVLSSRGTLGDRPDPLAPVT